MVVVENEEMGIIEIDGFKIEGWADDSLCETCGNKRIYFDTFDAFFCAQCNIWLESNCSDPTCEYCRNRPNKPLPPLE